MRSVLAILLVVLSVAGGIAGRTVTSARGPASWPVEPRERSVFENERSQAASLTAELGPLFSCSVADRRKVVDFLLARGDDLGAQRRDMLEARRRTLGIAPDVGLVISGGVAWVVTTSR